MRADISSAVMSFFLSKTVAPGSIICLISQADESMTVEAVFGSTYSVAGASSHTVSLTGYERMAATLSSVEGCVSSLSAEPSLDSTDFWGSVKWTSGAI